MQGALVSGWRSVSLQPLGDDGWVTVAELGSAEVTGATRPSWGFAACSLPRFWPAISADNPAKHWAGEL